MIPQLGTLATLFACTLPVWLILRGGWWYFRRPHRKLQPWREAALAVFAAFMAGLLMMALDGTWGTPSQLLASAAERLRTGDKIRLIPLQTIGAQVQQLPEIGAATQLLGNTLLFAPWGFFLPLLWPYFRRIRRTAAMALGLTLLIETTQLFINRHVEFDDVLLNFLGAMLGAWVWARLYRHCPALDRHLL